MKNKADKMLRRIGLTDNFAAGEICRVKLRSVFPIVLLLAIPVLPIEGASPQESLQRMKVADGFEVSLVANEPEVRQPISIAFDDRGRMWVVQYLQYPTPAGLKPVKVDQYLRTKYDKVPEPPPRGTKGADRITICEDTNGDGRGDKFHDFVSGLNLCSGMALGYGGVFVMNPPYLLFYSDRNRDDVPDSDPEVLLSGFGIEDAHAVANSLTWGPDGWLYGAQGSTVTANIRGIEFQQGIWRYHPRTHEFELFAEGGGNTWGVDFDENGELIAGTNFDDKMLHHVQGAYYVKNFGKHGELHNPHAYGYFGHVPYSGYRGGHLSTAGIVYQGGAFPAELRGTYISANPLDHAIYWHTLTPQGSSFTSRFGGPLLKTDDELFRPVDCQPGPDGALYIADWCDKRATHVDSLDTWDRSNGRIYRIQAKGAKPARKFDLSKLSGEELVNLLDDKNDWFVREARRILAERGDEKIFPRLRKQITQSESAHLQLQSLWALYASGGFSDQLALDLLGHTNTNVRAWTVRLLGDARKVSPQVRQRLEKIAGADPAPVVRRQLACSLKRLPSADALPLLSLLLRHDEDAADQHVPLLLWWALESNAVSHRTEVAKLFATAEVWQRRLFREHIAERLARRYAAEGSDVDFSVCARLLESAPGRSETEIILKGMELGMVGRKFDQMPASLVRWFQEAWVQGQFNLRLTRLGLRFGNKAVRDLAIRWIQEEQGAEAERVELIEVLGQTAGEECVPALLGAFRESGSAKIRGAALSALQRFRAPSVADALIEAYPRQNSETRARIRQALSTRAGWARLLVDAVDAKRIEVNDVSLDELRTMTALDDADLRARIEKLWGKVRTDSPEEKRNFINEVKLVLNPSGVAGRDAKGDPAEGKKVFTQACATCHKLFGEGNTIGPDLTGSDRKNTDLLLQNIVNPSGYIRPEYVAYDVETKDDQNISGLMVESTASAVTLVDRNNERHVLPRERISRLRESSLSLMPDGLLEGLKPQQIMDLFSYLRSDGGGGKSTGGNGK